MLHEQVTLVRQIDEVYPYIFPDFGISTGLAEKEQCPVRTLYGI